MSSWFPPEDLPAADSGQSFGGATEPNPSVWGRQPLGGAEQVQFAGGGDDTPLERAPVALLSAALAAGVFAVILAVLGRTMTWLAFAGWILAGPVGTVLLALYTLENTKRRASAWYVASSTATMLYWISLGVLLLGVIACAVVIALWAGTR